MTDPLGLIQSANVGGVKPPASTGGTGPAANVEGPGFRDVLMEQIGKVDELQQGADKAVEDLAAGRRNDPSNVMIATTKADLAYQTLLQVRNKLVDAYEEIKEMRV